MSLISGNSGFERPSLNVVLSPICAPCLILTFLPVVYLVLGASLSDAIDRNMRPHLIIIVVLIAAALTTPKLPLPGLQCEPWQEDDRCRYNHP